jgi:hypothetical protein
MYVLPDTITSYKTDWSTGLPHTSEAGTNLSSSTASYSIPAASAPAGFTPLPSVTPAPTVPADTISRLPAPSSVPPVLSPLPPVVSPLPPAVTYQHCTGNARRRRCSTKTAAKKAAATNAATKNAVADSTTQHQHITRSRHGSQPISGVTTALHTANLATQLEHFPRCANAVIDPATDASPEYEQLRSKAAHWIS